MENLPIFRHDQVMQLFAAGDYFDPGLRPSVKSVLYLEGIVY